MNMKRVCLVSASYLALSNILICYIAQNKSTGSVVVALYKSLAMNFWPFFLLREFLFRSEASNKIFVATLVFIMLIPSAFCAYLSFRKNSKFMVFIAFFLWQVSGYFCIFAVYA